MHRSVHCGAAGQQAQPAARSSTALAAERAVKNDFITPTVWIKRECLCSLQEVGQEPKDACSAWAKKANLLAFTVFDSQIKSQYCALFSTISCVCLQSCPFHNSHCCGAHFRSFYNPYFALSTNSNKCHRTKCTRVKIEHWAWLQPTGIWPAAPN